MSAPTKYIVRTERACKHCSRLAGATPDAVLRVRGWRLFEGTSLTGKAISDTVCPWCAGTATGPPPGWKVGCHTCDWEYGEEEEDDEPIATEREADQIARDHECEKWTWTKPPIASPVPVSEPVVTGSLL